VSELLSLPDRIVCILAGDDLSAGGPASSVVGRAVADGLRIERVDPQLIESIADAGTPQPVLAIGRIPAVGWADVGSGLIVVLDGVQDPGNVGTLTRTAAALGATAVILVGACADPWGPKALRAAAGSTFKLPVFRTGGAETRTQLASRGVPLWVARTDGAPLERGEERPEALALVLGSESHGVSDAMRAVAARAVGVKLHAGVESLNVAAAGAILLDRLRGE